MTRSASHSCKLTFRSTPREVPRLPSRASLPLGWDSATAIMPSFNHDLHGTGVLNVVTACSSIHGVSFPLWLTAILTAPAQSVRFSCQSTHAYTAILAALASFVIFLHRNSRFRPPFLQSWLRFARYLRPTQPRILFLSAHHGFVRSVSRTRVHHASCRRHVPHGFVRSVSRTDQATRADDRLDLLNARLTNISQGESLGTSTHTQPPIRKSGHKERYTRDHGREWNSRKRRDRKCHDEHDRPVQTAELPKTRISMASTHRMYQVYNF